MLNFGVLELLARAIRIDFYLVVGPRRIWSWHHDPATILKIEFSFSAQVLNWLEFSFQHMG
jgi:hypothetical protein